VEAHSQPSDQQSSHEEKNRIGGAAVQVWVWAWFCEQVVRRRKRFGLASSQEVMPNERRSQSVRRWERSAIELSCAM
jgi:hypothetical protein